MGTSTKQVTRRPSQPSDRRIVWVIDQESFETHKRLFRRQVDGRWFNDQANVIYDNLERNTFTSRKLALEALVDICNGRIVALESHRRRLIAQTCLERQKRD